MTFPLCPYLAFVRKDIACDSYEILDLHRSKFFYPLGDCGMTLAVKIKKTNGKGLKANILNFEPTGSAVSEEE